MNNINTVLNKIKKENDKNINTKERLIRKKTNNIVSQQKLTESITSKINSEKIKQLSISFPFKFLFNRQTSVKLVKPFFSNENNKQNIYNILYTETINDFCNFYKKEDKKNENKEKQILERKERLDDKEWENYVSIFSDEDLMNIKYIIKSIYNKINIFYKNYPFYKENINMKLVNVYQQYFAFNKKVSGWGDFIRGSYFLMQFCEEDKIDFDMDLSNHIISKFLKKYSNNKIFYLNYIEVKKKNIYKTIIKFEETNFMPKITKQGIILPESKNIQEVYNSFASYLNRQSFFCDYCKTFSNNFVEDIDISNKADINIDSHIKKIIQYEYAKTTSNTNTKYVHTVSFPFYGINNTHRERMKKEIEPSEEISEKVTNILTNMEVCDNKFVVLHIRCGDEYLLDKNKVFSKNFIIKIINDIKNWLSLLTKRGINTNEKKVFLIADNNYIKKQIIQHFPYFKTLFLDITHFGEGQELEEKKVENTAIDFFIMARSICIFALSTYQHGSGFSKWCAETYSIPYVCKYIINE